MSKSHANPSTSDMRVFREIKRIAMQHLLVQVMFNPPITFTILDAINLGLLLERSIRMAAVEKCTFPFIMRRILDTFHPIHILWQKCYFPYFWHDIHFLMDTFSYYGACR